MTDIFDFIQSLFIGDGLIIAAAAFVVGLIVKKSLTFIPDKFIPLIGGVLGAVLGLCILGLDVSAAVRGLCLGWAATGGHQTIKQLRKEEEGDI